MKMEFHKLFYKKIRSKWHRVVLSVLSGIIRSILILIPTLITRNIYNSLESNFSVNKIIFSAALTFVIPVIVMTLYIIDIKMSKYIFEIIKEIRVFTLKDIMKNKLRTILSYNYSEIYSVIIQSLGEIGDYYYLTLNTLTWYGTTVVVGIILMLYINFKISLVLLLLTSLKMVCVYLLLKSIKKAKQEENEIHVDRTTYANSLIKQNAFIKIANRSQFEMDVARTLTARSWSNTKKKIRNEQMINGITFLITTIRSLYLFFAAHSLFLSGSMLRGDFITLNSYIVWLTPVFLGFQKTLKNTIESGINKKRIGKYIQFKEEESSTNLIQPEKDLNEITVKNLTFSYNEQMKILDDISFMCSNGETLFITGASGSGKSTLLNILMTLEDSYGGEIYIDSHNIREIDNKWIHDNLVLVGQQVDILQTTLKENLLYSGVSVSDDELIESLNALKLDHLLEMPGGLNWDMKLHPRTLSDGEKKRIAILRALLSKPRILLLDEPTSGLDNLNKLNVMNYINQCIEGILIVVTHDVIYQEDDRIITVGG